MAYNVSVSRSEVEGLRGQVRALRKRVVRLEKLARATYPSVIPGTLYPRPTPPAGGGAEGEGREGVVVARGCPEMNDGEGSGSQGGGGVAEGVEGRGGGDSGGRRGVGLGGVEGWSEEELLVYAAVRGITRDCRESFNASARGVHDFLKVFGIELHPVRVIGPALQTLRLRKVLALEGRWYFVCPNTQASWETLCLVSSLFLKKGTRWNFVGKFDPRDAKAIQVDDWVICGIPVFYKGSPVRGRITEGKQAEHV